MNTTETKDMKAIAIDEFGGVEKLDVKNFPRPEMEEDQILIRTNFAGVGVWDNSEREGYFAKMMDKEPKFPKIMGTEGSGVVVKAGKKQDKFNEGDKVYGTLMPKAHNNGFYAEYAAMKSDQAFHIPKNLDLKQASVLAIDGGTALRGLRDTLKLKKGESILIFGASGGLGHLAVQLAKRMDARVFAVASGKDGVDLVRRLGADKVVNGREDDVLAAAKEFAPDGIDAALITAGGEKAQVALKALKDTGRVAYPMGVQPEPESINDLDVQSYNGDMDEELMKHLNQLVESGDFQVYIGKTYPMDEIVKAQKSINEHLLGRMNIEISERES